MSSSSVFWLEEHQRLKNFPNAPKSLWLLMLFTQISLILCRLHMDMHEKVFVTSTFSKPNKSYRGFFITPHCFQYFFLHIIREVKNKFIIRKTQKNDLSLETFFACLVLGICQGYMCKCITLANMFH